MVNEYKGKTCGHEKVFTQEETEGMKWLNEVLTKIIAKGPEHRSFLKAQAAAEAINKMDQHRHELHCATHALEERITMYVETQMWTLPPGEA